MFSERLDPTKSEERICEKIDMNDGWVKFSFGFYVQWERVLVVIKVNVITRLVFELTYFDVIVQHISNYVRKARLQFKFPSFSTDYFFVYTFSSSITIFANHFPREDNN